MSSPRAAAIAVALGLASSARLASANGAFPSSGQVLVDPTDESRIWVRTTYGLARTTDGGQSFQLVCEEGVGYSSGFHPHAAISPSGAIFMGLSDGLAVGRGDACAFERAAELEGSYVVDVSMGPDGRAIAVAIPPNGGDAQVYASNDDLATWSPLGQPLPGGVTPLTLDAAPSDPDVLYVSATLPGPQPLGVLLASADAGATWQSVVIPDSDAEVAPFIGGVDPSIAERLYVRLNGVPGRLLRSDDAGQSWTQIAETSNSRMQAFRLAPDGESALYGGDFSGLHRLDLLTLESEPLAPIRARCVTLDGARVFACADELSDGFTAGVSSDGGASFSPLLRASCIEGIIPCGAGEPVFEECEPRWPTIAQLIGADGACAGGAGTGGGGAGAGGAPAAGGAPGEGGASAGGAAEGGAGAGGAADGGDGCGCAILPATGGGHGPLGALFAVLWVCGRRARREAIILGASSRCR